MMNRSPTHRRAVIVTAAVAATALAGTAAGASVGLPRVLHASAAPAESHWADSNVVPGSEDGQAAGQVWAGNALTTATSTCVAPSASRTALKHTFDGAHMRWVVRVAKKLCQPLFVQDAQYRKPVQGRKDYPQTLVTTARLIRMQNVGTYAVPLTTRSSCVQTDTGASFGTPPRWPRTLAKLGVPQPLQLSHFSVGPNTWSSQPPAKCLPFAPVPAPTVKVACPADCKGIGTVTVTARNQTTNLNLRIAPVVNGKLLHDHVLTLGPGRTGSISFRAADGSRLTFGYVYSLQSSAPFKPFGKPIVILCPPGAPPVNLTVNCPCAGPTAGLLKIANTSRYVVQVAVFVNGVRGQTVAISGKHTGQLSFSMAKGATATFGYRYQINGVFQPLFTAIQLKVVAAG
jgi:hypothetical protein